MAHWLNVLPVGRMANQMLGLISGLYIARELDIPHVRRFAQRDWGIPSSGSLRHLMGYRRRVRLSGHDLDLDQLRRLARDHSHLSFESRVVGMRYEYVMSVRSEASCLFPAPVSLDPRLNLLKGHVLCHVRTGDVWKGDHGRPSVHPDYEQPPVAFYRAIQTIVDGPLAFVGEGLVTSPLGEALRDAFPDALLLSSGTPREDFQLLRTAPKLALSVSSFAWLATTLSPFPQEVHVPILGLLDPEKRPDIDAKVPQAIHYHFPDLESHQSVSRFIADASLTMRLSQMAEGHWMISGGTQDADN